LIELSFEHENIATAFPKEKSRVETLIELKSTNRGELPAIV
jgi:hypothetical protein